MIERRKDRKDSRNKSIQFSQPLLPPLRLADVHYVSGGSRTHTKLGLSWSNGTGIRRFVESKTWDSKNG